MINFLQIHYIDFIQQGSCHIIRLSSIAILFQNFTQLTRLLDKHQQNDIILYLKPFFLYQKECSFASSLLSIMPLKQTTMDYFFP